MKTDARVRYTRMRIREAFFECLQEKPVNRITVKELCERAQINRATFYTHYADPFDLLSKLEDEALMGLRAQIDAAMENGEDILAAVIEGMAHPQSGRALLVSSNADPEFSGRISELFSERYLQTLGARLPELSESERRAAWRFLTGGCANVLKDWLNRDPRLSAEEMARCMRRFCNGFVETLGRQ